MAQEQLWQHDHRIGCTAGIRTTIVGDHAVKDQIL